MFEFLLVFGNELRSFVTDEFKFDFGNLFNELIETDPVDHAIVVEVSSCVFKVVFIDLNQDFELTFSDVEAVQTRQEIVSDEAAN